MPLKIGRTLLGVASLLLPFWIFSADAPAVPSEPSIYPFSEGTTWIYQVGNQEKSTVVKRHADYPVGDKLIPAAIIKKTDGSEHYVVRSENEWLECRGISASDQNLGCQQPIHFFRWPLAIGDRWASGEIEFVVTAQEPVVVPFRRFPAAFKIVYVSSGAPDPIGEMWMVKGVGLVRLREASADFRLTRFTPGTGPDLEKASPEAWAGLFKPAAPILAEAPSPSLRSRFTTSLEDQRTLPWLLVTILLVMIFILVFLGIRTLQDREQKEEAIEELPPKDKKKFVIALAAGGDYRQAKHRLLEMVEKHPDFADLHYHLALLYKADSDLDLALKHFRDAVTINETYANAHIELGKLLVHMSQPEAAIEHFEQVIQDHPSYCDAYLELGRCLLALGKTSKARKAVEQALEQNPDFEPAQALLSQCRETAQTQKKRGPRSKSKTT